MRGSGPPEPVAAGDYAMTAPFAPPPSRPIVAVTLGMVAVAVAMPFARRDDAIGWIAAAVVLGAAVGIWSLLLWGLGRATLQWWRDRRDGG